LRRMQPEYGFWMSSRWSPQQRSRLRAWRSRQRSRLRDVVPIGERNARRHRLVTLRNAVLVGALHASRHHEDGAVLEELPLVSRNNAGLAPLTPPDLTRAEI
jgi:hypothetical protein